MLGKHKSNRLDIVILAVIVLIGLIKLPQPFMGDQAWYATTASNVYRGDVLYRDVWEGKQPGIVVFYLVGGAIFGFSEVGIHTFELIFMFVFSLTMMIALRDYFENRAMVSLSPLFAVGIYYGIAGVWLQTQAEALVGFPLFLTMWLAFKASRSVEGRNRYWFASGFMGGVVLLFKLVYFPIILAFWLTMLLEPANRRPQAIAQFSVPVLLGMSLPLLAVLIYFLWYDILDIVYWTFFEYPARIIKEVPLNLFVLRDRLRWFTLYFSPLMALASVGAYASFRGRQASMTLNFLVWLLVGAGVIFVQRVWFEYHFFLLLVPLGLLAARGVDVIWVFTEKTSSMSVMRGRRMVIVLSFFLLFSHPISSLALSGISLARDGFALSKEQRLEYQIELNGSYQWITQETAFLSEPGSIPGDIYVIGDPLYYFLSGRDPAIPLPALWFRALPEQWIQMMNLLDEKRPPYIFVDGNAFDVVRYEDTPKMVPYLEQTILHIKENYRVLRSSDVGVWYVLRNR